MIDDVLLAHQEIQAAKLSRISDIHISKNTKMSFIQLAAMLMWSGIVHNCIPVDPSSNLALEVIR